jgi:hypothetical protein
LPRRELKEPIGFPGVRLIGFLLFEIIPGQNRWAGSKPSQTKKEKNRNLGKDYGSYYAKENEN